jgi:flagellar hook-length control protein FliK
VRIDVLAAFFAPTAPVGETAEIQGGQIVEGAANFLSVMQEADSALEEGQAPAQEQEMCQPAETPVPAALGVAVLLPELETLSTGGTAETVYAPVEDKALAPEPDAAEPESEETGIQEDQIPEAVDLPAGTVETQVLPETNPPVVALVVPEIPQCQPATEIETQAPQEDTPATEPASEVPQAAVESESQTTPASEAPAAKPDSHAPQAEDDAAADVTTPSGKPLPRASRHVRTPGFSRHGHFRTFDVRSADVQPHSVGSPGESAAHIASPSQLVRHAAPHWIPVSSLAQPIAPSVQDEAVTTTPAPAPDVAEIAAPESITTAPKSESPDFGLILPSNPAESPVPLTTPASGTAESLVPLTTPASEPAAGTQVASLAPEIPVTGISGITAEPELEAVSAPGKPGLEVVSAPGKPEVKATPQLPLSVTRVQASVPNAPAVESASRPTADAEAETASTPIESDVPTSAKFPIYVPRAASPSPVVSKGVEAKAAVAASYATGFVRMPAREMSWPQAIEPVRQNPEAETGISETGRTIEPAAKAAAKTDNAAAGLEQVLILPQPIQLGSGRQRVSSVSAFQDTESAKGTALRGTAPIVPVAPAAVILPPAAAYQPEVEEHVAVAASSEEAPSGASDSTAAKSGQTNTEPRSAFAGTVKQAVEAGRTDTEVERPAPPQAAAAAKAPRETLEVRGASERPSPPAHATTPVSSTVSTANTARPTVVRATPPTSQAPQADLIQQLANRIHAQYDAGGGGLRIQLRPANLGRVEISAEPGAAGVVARIVTESPAVKQYLEGNLHVLEQALSDQGLRVDRLDVVAQSFDFRQSMGQQNQTGGSGHPDRSGSSSAHGAVRDSGSVEITADPAVLTVLGPNSTFHTVA